MGAGSQVLSCVYVGNVSASVGQRELQTVFGQCGPIAELRLAGNPGFSTVYGFVQYYTQRDAEAALGLNGALLDSRAIRVSMAKQTVSRPEQQGSGAPVAPGLRPWSAPPVPLPKVASSQPANIIQAQAQARLMQLSALNMLVPAVAATPAAGPGKSKKPQHDPGKVKRTIFVSKLPQDVSEQDLAKAFANFGAVTAVRVSQRRGQRAAQAWVELDSSSAAARACRSTTTVVLGGQVLGVQASQTAIHTSTLPCSGSSSPARSPSSSQQGTAATPAQQPDQSASGAAGAAGSPEGRAQPPSSEQPAVALPKASIPGDPQPQPPGKPGEAGSAADPVRMKRPAPDAAASKAQEQPPEHANGRLPDSNAAKRVRRAASV